MKKIAFFLVVSLSAITSLVNASDFSIGVEYLYWNVLQSSMSYATTVDSVPALNNPTIVTQPQDWTSGFRLTAAKEIKCDLNTSFSWTRVHNSVKGSVSNPFIIATEIFSPGPGGIGIGGNGVGGPASSQWNCNFDMLDLNFTCPGFEDFAYSICPLVGVKGGRIYQNQFITYDNFVDTNTGVFFNATVNEKNNLWCVGPKIGFNSAYELGNGLSFLGNFSTSFLYGRLFSSTNTQIVEPGVPSVDTTLTNIKRRIMPQFQLLLGLNWDTCLCDCYEASIGVGYEVQYFFHTWRISNSSIQNFYVTNTGFGDLMLHGLTANLSVRF